MKHITPYNLFENNTTNQINSANFINWFGDWKNDPENSSKVTENGTPKICYHGTYENFDTFDITNIGKGSGNYGHYGYGFYFSDDIREAETYGNTIMKVYLNIRNPFIPSDEKYDLLKDNGIYWIDDKIRKTIDYNSVYNELIKIDKIAAKLLKYISEYGYEKGWSRLQIEEDISYAKIDLNDINDICEYILDDSGVPDYIEDLFKNIGINSDNIKYNYGYQYHQSLHWITNLGERSKEVTDVIKKLGFDGIIAGSEHIVFDSKNIKSIENNGDFSNSDNIYESVQNEEKLKEKLNMLFPEYVKDNFWVISRTDTYKFYISYCMELDENGDLITDNVLVIKRIEDSKGLYLSEEIESYYIDDFSFRMLIKSASKIKEKCSYRYQKEFLTEFPEKYKELEYFGYADGIKEEFDWLFNAADMGLM